MRVLFITFTYLKGNRGGIYASRTHINLFSELSQEMTLLYPYMNGMEPDGINVEKINMVPVKDKRCKVRKYIDLLIGRRHRFVEFAKEYIDINRFDTVVFDSSTVSACLIEKFKMAGMRIITIHHNYEVEYIRADGSILTKYPELFWIKIQEKRAVCLSDLNLTLTNEDANLFRMHYSKEACYETLGVYDYQPRKYNIVQNKQRKHNYLITGGLGSKQNEKSLISWLLKYFPILKKVDPEAVLTLAGREPSTRLVKIAQSVGAEVIASPQEMYPILDKNDFYICTTDCGGGLKLRIMDGLKGGMPVLTHIVSARGYEKMVKEGIVFPYNNECTFEESLRNMISTNWSRQDIQYKYINQYSFTKGIKILKNILMKHNLI